MCKFNEAAEKAMWEALNQPIPGAIYERPNPKDPQRMVRPKERSAILAYHVYPLVEQSDSFFIVKDNPTLPDCIPMKRFGAKTIALPKADWELVPRYEWREVTKEVMDTGDGVLIHDNRLIRLHDPDFQVSIKRRVEVKD